MISKEYKKMLQREHRRASFGKRAKMPRHLYDFIIHCDPQTILDFGCGKGKLIETLKVQFSEVQLKNEIIESQLAKSYIRFRLSVVIIVMGLGIIFLMVRNYKKNRALHFLSAIQTQNELLKKELEKFELSESLKETSEELTTSILNIKKVALLKKQLENIVDEKNPEYNEKDTLKKLKLCLNSFFAICPHMASTNSLL
jgi:hypothetical protein